MPVIWSSNELVEHDFPTPAFLVEPIIPQGGIVLLHGKPGVGKTQLVLTLAEAINSGGLFLGRFPSRKGTVVVIQADMPTQIQQDRLRRIHSAVQLANTHWVGEEDGSTPHINIKTLSLMEPDLVQSIRDLDPALVVWDTLRKIHHLPEAASETAIIVYQAAQKLCPLATHAFIHHDRKASRDPEAFLHEDEGFMGSQQWKGAADTQIQLRTLSDSIPKRLVLSFHKARTASDYDAQDIHLEMDMHTILLNPTD